MARHRRPSVRRCRGVHPPGRTGQGPDHPRWPRHRSGHDRRCVAGPPRRQARPPWGGPIPMLARSLPHWSPSRPELPFAHRAQPLGDRRRARASGGTQARRDPRGTPADLGGQATQAGAATPTAEQAARAELTGTAAAVRSRPCSWTARSRPHPRCGRRRRGSRGPLALRLEMEADMNLKTIQET